MGWCGMSAAVGRDGVRHVLYRAFRPPDQRNMYLLSIEAAGTERPLLETIIY